MKINPLMTDVSISFYFEDNAISFVKPAVVPVAIGSRISLLSLLRT